MIRSLLVSAAYVALLAAPTAAASAQDPASYIARIEAPRIPGDTGLAGRTLPELLRATGVPGVSLTVIHDFAAHWTKGYGVADVTTGRLVDSHTRFQAASISKPVTAMAVMRLVQDGKLSLDADINTILRSWQVPESEFTRTQKVTLRSLLAHTSGADDGFGFPGYRPDSARPTLVQILNGERPSNVGPVRFARPPFERYKYSGGGLTIVQLALTDLTGRDFAEFMRETVLVPLGMRASDFAQPAPTVGHAQLAHAHNALGQAMPAPWHVYPEQAAAGLWTTSQDLARLVIEMQRARRGPRGALLSQASAQEMLTPVGVGNYGVGFGMSPDGEGWYFGHGGSNYGFQASITGHMRKGYGFVVMTNGSRGQAVINEIRKRVAIAYEWDSEVTPLRR